MADEQHLALIEQGVAVWNNWREENPRLYPNLNMANLRGADLLRVDLREANLSRADLSSSFLNSYTNLRGANLNRARLYRADLEFANLNGTDLTEATLAQTNFSKANLDECFIYGISAWGLKDCNKTTVGASKLSHFWSKHGHSPEYALEGHTAVPRRAVSIPTQEHFCSVHQTEFRKFWKGWPGLVLTQML
jgi:uncharacterized protein YjbI with pentapeptide repeats